MMFGTYVQRSAFSGLALPLVSIAVAAVAVVALVILDNAKSAGSLKEAAKRNAEMAQAQRLGRDEDAANFQRTLESQNSIAKAASDARAAAVARQAARDARLAGRQEGIAQGRQDALREAAERPAPKGLPICPANCLLQPPA